MKKLILVLLSLSLSGCGGCSRQTAWVTGYDEICVDGVTYLQFPSGVSPKYRANGSLETCE